MIFHTLIVLSKRAFDGIQCMLEPFQIVVKFTNIADYLWVYLIASPKMIGIR
jgi:hypothetical protein